MRSKNLRCLRLLGGLAASVVLIACPGRSATEFAASPSNPAATNGPTAPRPEQEPAGSEAQPAGSALPPPGPLPPRRPPPDVGYPRLTIVARDLAADEGYSTTYHIAATGSFLLNAEGSTGGSEMQGKDCVGRLAAKDVARPLERVAADAKLTQPPRGRGIQDAVDQNVWVDYTIGYQTNAKTTRYVADSDRWAVELAALMAQVDKAARCTHYLDKG